MLRIDATRISEMFARDIGDKLEDITLENFLKMASKKGSESPGIAEVERCLSFEGFKEETEVRIKLSYLNILPELIGIKIKGRIGSIKDVLELSYGNLCAEFEGIDIERSNLDKKIVRIPGNYINRQGFRIYLMTGANGQRLIKKLETEKPNIPFQARGESKVKSYGENVALLSEAARIDIKNLHYVDNNPAKALLNEDLEILQVSKGNYLFEYALRANNHADIPGTAFGNVESIFNLVRENFGKQTLEKIKMVPGGSL